MRKLQIELKQVEEETEKSEETKHTQKRTARKTNGNVE